MGMFDKIVKSVVGGVAKSVGSNKLLGTGLDPLSIGTSIASEYALKSMGGGGGRRGKIARSPEVKAARLEKRTGIQEAKPMGAAAVKTARQEGRAGVQAAREAARTRIQQEKTDKKLVTPKRPTKMFKEGGSVMKKKDMMDMEGRALKRKTADAKGRAMKKTASKTGKTGYGGVIAMGMKKGGSAKKGK